MQFDVAVNLLCKAKDSLVSYRNTGFVTAQVIAKDICEEMNVETVLKEKRLRSTKRQFAYEAPDEPFADAQKRLEVEILLLVCLIERFKTLADVRESFGALLNFTTLNQEDLSTRCEKLSKILSSGITQILMEKN